MSDPTVRLIPEPELRAQITGVWAEPEWGHTDAEVLDIAEARLLLGLPANTDLMSGEMFLRVVRRVVLLERQVAELPDRIRAASELDDSEQEHLVIVGDSGQVDIRHPRHEALGLADPEPCALAGFLVRHREAGGVLQPGPFRVRPVGPAAGAWTWEPLP